MESDYDKEEKICLVGNFYPPFICVVFFLVIHDFFANRSWAWHLIDEYVNHDNMALADFKKNKRILKIFRHSAEMFLPTQIRKINV